MIRKICCALLLLMAALPAAYAAQPLAVVPPPGDRRPAHSAVVCTSEETAPLYRLPDEDSGVLMRYYGSAPVQVLRPADGGFYRVQAGEPGAGVAGYMRVGDVELDAAAQRGVRPRYMELQFNREADVYAYCDAGALVIGRCDTAPHLLRHGQKRRQMGAAVSAAADARLAAAGQDHLRLCAAGDGHGARPLA